VAGLDRRRRHSDLPTLVRVFFYGAYPAMLRVIPEVETAPQAHVYSPRLGHPAQADDFAKQVIEVSADAEL
jgi:hypothetical protein